MARILVIDDSSFQRRILKDLLRKLGHESIGATNGAMGLELLKYESVDGVLVDLLMPVMDGIEFLEALRDQEVRPPAAVVTADDYDYVREQCDELGATGLLSKPVEMADLEDTLARLFSTKSC